MTQQRLGRHRFDLPTEPEGGPRGDQPGVPGRRRAGFRSAPGDAKWSPSAPLTGGRADSGTFGTLAVKVLVALGLGALLLANGVSSMSLVLLVVIAALAIDTGNLFTLKNFLLVYTVLVFGIGGGFFHLTGRPIYADIVGYTLAFLGGYALSAMASAARIQDVDRVHVPSGKGPLSLFALEHALLVLIGLNLLFLAFQFLKYGVVGYYQGQGLLDQALTYGKASSSGGAEQIARFALSDSSVALVILYAQACFESSTRIRYRYPAMLFVALPVLSLSRFNAVVGSLALFALYACDRRLSARRLAFSGPANDGAAFADARAAPTAETSAARAQPPVNRAALVVLGLVVALAAGAFVASIRGGFSNKVGTAGHAPDTVAMFTSELSPVQAYGDIKANIDVLGHPHGRTIVLPFLLKVVPRAWYPNKPLNSGAFYMSTIRPAEWAAGYALPPTYFGDAYLSFGFGGALIASVLLGLICAPLDTGYRQMVLRRLPWFLLIFANFYPLMRDALSESLAGIALTLLVWAAGNRMFRPTRPVDTSRVAAGR